MVQVLGYFGSMVGCTAPAKKRPSMRRSRVTAFTSAFATPRAVQRPRQLKDFCPLGVPDAPVAPAMPAHRGALCLMPWHAKRRGTAQSPMACLISAVRAAMP